MPKPVSISTSGNLCNIFWIKYVCSWASLCSNFFHLILIPAILKSNWNSLQNRSNHCLQHGRVMNPKVLSIISIQYGYVDSHTSPILRKNWTTFSLTSSTKKVLLIRTFHQKFSLVLLEREFTLQFQILVFPFCCIILPRRKKKLKIKILKFWKNQRVEKYTVKWNHHQKLIF